MCGSVLWQFISLVLCSDLIMALENAVVFTLALANGVIPFHIELWRALILASLIYILFPYKDRGSDQTVVCPQVATDPLA
jgi:hypothetical protein